MTEEQLLDNWIPHDHVWGESGPVPVEILGGVVFGRGGGLDKSVWKADLVIDDSAASLLLQIMRSDAKAGFSNNKKKSPVYSSTSNLLVRIIGRERLDIFERELDRLPSWIEYDERYFTPCKKCEDLEPTGYAKDGKSHYCDYCLEFECSLHNHCEDCGDCEIPFSDELRGGICSDCWDTRQREDESRWEEEEEEAARRKEDQDWKDEFEPEW
mgnify:CR=1 FL=1